MNNLTQTKAVIGIFVSLVLLCACNQKKSSISDEKPNSQEILVNPDATGEENVTEFFKEVKFIKLESSEENLIGEITKMVFSVGRIYILDRFTQTIFIFDMQGKLITKIRNVGEGPGEYRNLQDFTLDSEKKELVIYDISHQKFLFYDLNGKYKREIRNGLFFDNLFPLGEDGLWGLVSASKSNGISNYYNILFYNQNDNQILNRFLPFLHPALPGIIQANNLSVTEEGVLFTYPFCDTLYSVAKNGVIPKYFVSCDKFVNAKEAENYNMTSSEVYSKFDDEGKYFRYFHLAETGEWIYFAYAIHQRIFYVYYSKRTKNTINIRKITFDGGLHLSAHRSSYGDYFVSRAEAQVLFNLKEKLTGDIGALAKSISVADNPVLILCKMK